MKFINKTSEKQLINTLKESHSVLSGSFIELEITDIYPHELKRVEKFFKIETEILKSENKKPTANVDKYTKTNTSEV